MSQGYDPFVRGPFPTGVRTIQALDSARDRLFPCEIWYPAAAQHAGQDLAAETQDSFTAQPMNTVRRQAAVRDAAARAGTYPLVIFSHSSGAGRRSATFLCTHLSSHGYIVAALDHSEVLAAELARKDNETPAQKSARWESLDIVLVAGRHWRSPKSSSGSVLWWRSRLAEVLNPGPEFFR